MNKTWRTHEKIAKTLGILTTLLVLIYSLLIPSRSLGATETGGYPWADASVVRAATYDWGYRTCQPAMQVAKTCPGHVTTKLGVRYYQSDPWHYDVRNCTSYVAWRMYQEFAVNIPNWGNANNWDSAARRAGYLVDSNPAEGSIAQWKGHYGHVGYVVAVNDDNSVNIEQYNKAGTGMFSRQSRVKADHYIHVQDKQSTKPVETMTTSSASIEPEKAQLYEEKRVTVPALAALTPINGSALPIQNGVSYTPALDPAKDEINVYAVEYRTTNSGKIEVSKTSMEDGNTAWQQHWQTNQAVITSDPVKFLVADINSDGLLDLYIIRTNVSTKHEPEITILDGSKGFAQDIGDWQTSQNFVSEDHDFSLADYDGNGSLDLYSIRSEPEQVDITILDGSSQFGTSLAEWHAPLSVADKKLSYVLGDHNRDGRADVYALGQDVTVLGADFNYQKPIKVWKREQS